MSLDLSFIPLEASDLVGEGGERWIYCSKAYPALVFKKQKPVDARDLKNNFKGNSMRLFPSLATRVVKKEYQAYVSCCLSVERDLDDLPVSKLYGFARSTVGLVQIAEKASLDGVSLGPTLDKLHRDGDFNADQLGLLNEFVQSMLAWNIPTNDVSGRNVVLGMRNGVAKFICVDGFGDIHFIPGRTYVKAIRRNQFANRMTKLAARLDLRFDRQTFLFHLADQ